MHEKQTMETASFHGQPLLESPLNSKGINQSILKEIIPEYPWKGLMLKIKFQYFGHLMGRTDTGKDLDARKDWRQEEKGTKEVEMVGWHHRLNGHEFEQTPGDGEGQRRLVCCSPRGTKELDMIEWLNSNNILREEDRVAVSPPQGTTVLFPETERRLRWHWGTSRWLESPLSLCPWPVMTTNHRSCSPSIHLPPYPGWPQPLRICVSEQKDSGISLAIQ